MTINYKKAYLTDGTQVKITYELYKQLIQWEQEGYDIPFQYKDMLMREDNVAINAERRYFRHNMSLDELLLKEHTNPSLLKDENANVERTCLMREEKKLIMKVLNFCTETQKRRFIKYYYLGITQNEIAIAENTCQQAISKSIVFVEQLLINCEQIK